MESVGEGVTDVKAGDVSSPCLVFDTKCLQVCDFDGFYQNMGGLLGK